MNRAKRCWGVLVKPKRCRNWRWLRWWSFLPPIKTTPKNAERMARAYSRAGRGEAKVKEVGGKDL